MFAQLPTPSTPVLSCAEGVATIVLNRPAQRNRLEGEDLKTLLAHFDAVDADRNVRVLVLTANTASQPKPVFCSGYDISGFDDDAHSANAFEVIPDRLSRLRPVTVCALNGSVYGGATDLVLACDLRIGLHGIEWRMPATALGLHFYASGLKRYVHRFGVAATQRAFLTARPFDEDRLRDLGLFETFCSEDQWHSVNLKLIEDILALSPLALETTKQSINELIRGEDQEARMRERERLTARSDDFAEGRAAFAERRKPIFKVPRA